MKQDEPAKFSDGGLRGDESVAILERILYFHKIVNPDLRKGDTLPNIDGYLQLLNNRRIEVGKLEVQVKTLEKRTIATRISYYFKDEKFISYCKNSRQLPVLLIGVDREQDVAYWVDMTEYVQTSYTKSIRFPKEQIISKINRTYYDSWKRICETRQKVWDEHLERKRTASQATLKKPLKSGTVLDYDSLIKARSSLKIYTGYRYYYPFIDFLEPFYLNEEGAEKRERLRMIFHITEEEELEIINKLSKDGLLKIIGDLCLVKDKSLVNALMGEIIDKEAISLDFLTNMF